MKIIQCPPAGEDIMESGEFLNKMPGQKHIARKKPCLKCGKQVEYTRLDFCRKCWNKIKGNHKLISHFYEKDCEKELEKMKGSGLWDEIN